MNLVNVIKINIVSIFIFLNISIFFLQNLKSNLTFIVLENDCYFSSSFMCNRLLRQFKTIVSAIVFTLFSDYMGHLYVKTYSVHGMLSAKIIVKACERNHESAALI